MMHLPVMVEEVVACWSNKKIRTFFDATVGAGGHAKGILESHPELDLYIGCDRDLEALQLSRDALVQWKDKLVLFHGDFCDLDRMLYSLGICEVDGFFLI